MGRWPQRPSDSAGLGGGGRCSGAIPVKSRAQGFTLVEVMVSLAILSLVMLVTVSGFRTLGNTATSISAMTGRTDELRSVSMFLRDAF